MSTHHIRFRKAQRIMKYDYSDSALESAAEILIGCLNPGGKWPVEHGDELPSGYIDLVREVYAAAAEVLGMSEADKPGPSEAELTELKCLREGIFKAFAAPRNSRYEENVNKAVTALNTALAALGLSE